MDDLRQTASGVACVCRDSPVSRLPCDVLLEIFLSLQSEYRSDAVYKDRKTNIYWMRSVSHVCRSWRRWTISSPLLWTFVVAGSLRITKLFLARCNDLSLDVYCNIGTKSFNEDLSPKIESVVLCASRVRSLRLYLPREMYQIDSWESLRFPRMTTFIVSKNVSQSGPAPPFLHMAANDLPCLQELRVEGFGLLCVGDPLIMTRLRKLEIYDGCETNDLEDVMEMLAMLNGGVLEELSLVDVFPNPPAIDYIAHGTPEEHLQPSFPYSISLPCLRRLYLDGAVVCCEAFLRHAVLPPGVVATLNFIEDSDFLGLTRVFTSVGPKFLQPVAPGLPEGPVSLSVTQSYCNEYFTVSAWTTLLPYSSFYALSEPSPESAPSMRLPDPSLEFNLVRYLPSEIAGALAFGLRTAATRMFSFTYMHSPADDCRKCFGRLSLSDVLSKLPSVETISITGHQAVADLPVILSPPSAEETSGLCNVPRLRALNIGPSETDVEESVSPSESHLGSLIDSLHARKAAGYGLELLRLPSNYLDVLNASQVERLNGCVPVVSTWA